MVSAVPVAARQYGIQPVTSNILGVAAKVKLGILTAKQATKMAGTSNALDNFIVVYMRRPSVPFLSLVRKIHALPFMNHAPSALKREILPFRIACRCTCTKNTYATPR